MPRRILVRRTLRAPAIPAAVLLALAIVGPRMAAVHIVAAGSPPLLTGDGLLVERRAYRRHAPRRGDLLAVRIGGAEVLGRVLALPGETIGSGASAVRLGGKALPRWRIADQLAPACALDGGDAPDCHRRRMRAAFPDGRLLDLPEPLIVPERTVPPGHLLLLGPGGMTRLAPSGAIVGRAGVILLSWRGGASWREPATWPHAVRWERSGQRP